MKTDRRETERVFFALSDSLVSDPTMDSAESSNSDAEEVRQFLLGQANHIYQQEEFLIGEITMAELKRRMQWVHILEVFL
jgi:hypothetical protein